VPTPTVPGGNGGVQGVPNGTDGAAATGSGTLPVTGDNSALLTTAGITFIVAGAGVLYFTRLKNEPQAPAGGVPGARRSETPVRRRRPSPLRQGGHQGG
jgi:LPXTG-motif cell wall-anchored protein